ncbi:membrane-associated protein, putative [Bodo saltans]|uniref:Membrane-associated protein, putative n=1 Tax=Bodo saltans TaxID=75058 RepID=A0A0S4IWI9_BODSA|nr:membrane-associated protein, putative [Bodo saltans]|eukprot:CUG05290.1 membrane-associated protein, putative [Bodo saltans]
MPTTVSVRAVVGGLLVFTSAAVIICSIIPIFVVLKHVAINFVLSGTAAEADKVQFVVSTALQRASLFGDILQRALLSYDQQHHHFNASSASESDGDLSATFWKLAQWSAATVVTKSVRIVMAASMNNSFDSLNSTATRWLVMSSSADASTPPTETNVVRIVNFTSLSLIQSGGGNLVADLGYFDASTTSLAPINTSHPWQYNVSIPLSDLPGLSILFGDLQRSLPSPSSPSISALSSSWRIDETSSTTTLQYVAADVNVLTRRSLFLAVDLPAVTLSSVIASTNISYAGASILFDASTAYVVASNTEDQLSSWNNDNNASSDDGSGIGLQNLIDPRVSPIFHARSVTQQGDVVDGATAVMRCATPCSFLYWAHKGELTLDTNTLGLFDLLFYNFVSVQIVDVKTGGGSRSATAAADALNLRLMETTSEYEVLHVQLRRFEWAVAAPFFLVGVVWIIFMVSVGRALKGLGEAEHNIGLLAQLFVQGGGGKETYAANSDAREENAEKLPHHVGNGSTPAVTSSVFYEIKFMLKAIDGLCRELLLLRAFSGLNTAAGLFQSQAQPVSTEGSSSATALDSLGEDGAAAVSPSTSLTQRTPSSSSPTMPRVMSVPSGRKNMSPNHHHGAVAPLFPTYDLRGLWKVPITSVHISVASLGGGHSDAEVHAADPVRLHQRQCSILSVLQKSTSRFSGASVDHFFGDQFLLHFNAIKRTPKHVLCAMTVLDECLRMIDALDRQTSPSDHQVAGPPNVENTHHKEQCVSMTCGIASSVALCGLMGPAALKTFTVVSNSEPQAAAMTRVAEALHISAVMTWRAVEIARHELQKSSTANTQAKVEKQQRDAPTQKSGHKTYRFFPVARVSLPGESSSGGTPLASTAYTFDYFQ